MTRYIFDESDEYFRYPHGALETPGSLTVRLKLRRGDAAYPRVGICPDGGDIREQPMEFDCVAGAYDVYRCELKIDAPGLYWYHFIVDYANSPGITIPEEYGGGLQITAYARPDVTPDWIRGGLIYHIFVDRFYRGGALALRPGAVFRPDWGGCPRFLPDDEGIVLNNDFFGGDIYGIIEKLPYLEEMGVTCVYLSPIFDAASNHKYDTGDYMRIDPAFGGDEAFEKLCVDAGARGIKIILDGVFNHVGSDSRYFNRYGRFDSLGAYQSEQSQYRDWFTFREDGTYASWWDIELLPATNKSNEGFRDFICGEDGVIAHWTKKGVSGWRLDVVDELPDIFLDPLCTAIKRENNRALIVGEVWEDASYKIAYDVRRRYFLGKQLDSVTNYPLKDALIACVKDGDVIRLADTVTTLCRNYPENVIHSLMNVVGTHDTMRILTVLGGAEYPDNKIAASTLSLDEDALKTAKRRLRLISTLQYTLPGVPCVFYGDEAGVEGGADPFNRRCYPWGKEDPDLIGWYRTLAGLRKSNKCFTDGEYALVEAREGLFAFTRGKGRERALIAVNVSGGDRALKADGFNFNLLTNEYEEALVVKAGEPAVYKAAPTTPDRRFP